MLRDRRIPTVAIFAAALLGLTLNAQADWVVDNAHSRLSFVSIKADTVAEVHHFTELVGTLSVDGTFRLDIPLASVETMIPIRNERLRELLFDTERFPTASLAATLDIIALAELPVGGQMSLASEAQLMLHGKTTNLTVETRVARLDDDTLLVASLQPLTVNADQLGLGDGVEKLREIAGLSSISPAVPVSFLLTLRSRETLSALSGP